MVKALIAVTSYNDVFYDDGAKTGLFVSEALHPFLVFKEHNYDVEFVSETGTVGYDEHSLSPDFLNGKDAEVFNDKNSDFNISISKIKKASDINGDDYKIVYFAGGHGTVYDFPQATGLHKIAQQIWKSNGVVAAVCHGPAIFDGLNDPENPNKLLVEGKTITGFTNAGEEIMGVVETLKKKNLGSIENLSTRLGAKFSPPSAPFEEHSIAQGRLVTGANPASASSTAVKAIKALSS
ncbi:unnamed protein product [Debaryomyces tyrocola]|nr:unnamed protein product [Debaryomyces tyrocola]